MLCWLSGIAASGIVPSSLKFPLHCPQNSLIMVCTPFSKKRLGTKKIAFITNDLL